MTEPAARQKGVAKTLPPSKSPAPAPPAPESYAAPAVPFHEPLVGLLRGFIAFQREKLNKASAAHGLNRSGSSAIAAQATITFLLQLEGLVDWVEAGQPSAETILTEDERNRWLWAKQQGMDVPEYIARQLP